MPRMTRALRSVLISLILRPIRREKIRTSLTVAGIAVGVAVIVAIQLANQSALRAFRESIDAVSGRANYQISSDSGELNEAVLAQLQPYWGDGLRFAPVIDLEGLLEVSETPIRILGVDLLSDLQFRDYRYARVLTSGNQQRSGASPTEIASFFELFRPDSIILPAPFARERGLALGSPVILSVLGNRRTMIVRGILEAKGPATAFNGAIAVCDIATAQQAFGFTGRLSRIDLLIPDERAEQIAALIRTRMPPGTRIERPSRRNDRVEKMLRAFRVNLFALAGVALLVGVFLVYNTVLISILRRRRDIGIAKTLGVTPRQIFFAFLGEGAVFGTLGSILGVGLGVLLARGVLELVGRTINALYVSTPPQTVELTPSVALLGLGVGVLLSTFSSMQPSFEASRVPPNVMIRPGLHQRITSRTELLLAFAAIGAFVAALLSTRIPPIGGIAVGGYVAVLFVVAGFSLLSPSIVRLTCALLAPLLRRLFGIVGQLAAASLPGSLRRTAVAAAALALAIGMMVAVALMVGSFRETVRIWVDQTVSSDLWLRPAKGLSLAQSALFPPEIVDELRKVPFIRGVDPVRGRDILYRDTIVNVGSGDFRVAAEYSTLPMIAPGSFHEAAQHALRSNGVFVSESFSLRFEKGVGDTLEIPVANGTMRAPIVGVYRDYSNDRGVIVMDRALYVRAFNDRAINTVVLFLKPGTDREQARRALEATFGPKYHAFTVSSSEIKTEVMKIFDQTFMITYALLFVAIIVAVLGIVNTLAALILERTRELALLRVTGLTPADIRRMLLIESSLLGLASTLSGAVMGYALSWILINVINKQSFGWTIEFHVPTQLIATSLLITLVSAALAGLVPARLANRIDVVSAIKS